MFIYVKMPTIAGPSSAFEKWSGHETSKTSAEGTSWGEHERGIPPLVRGVRGISPKKILYFRTPVEKVLMHLPLKRCLFYKFHYDEATSWSKTMKPESYCSQDLPCRRNAEGS